MTRMLVVASPTLSPLSTAVPVDGPYPFAVAVWQEAAKPDVDQDEGDCIGPECDRRTNGWFAAGDWGAGWYCGWCEAVPLATPGGAVVATVQVTGKSHGCSPSCALHPCGRGDLDGWHTPTSAVTRLDVPIPMGRPERPDYSHGDTSSVPASWWWADLDLEVPA